MTEGIAIALIALAGVLVQSWMANRKTRLQNTAEHETNKAAAKASAEAQMTAILNVHADVRGLHEKVDDHVAMLVDHITDDHTHRREVA